MHPNLLKKRQTAMATHADKSPVSCISQILLRLLVFAATLTAACLVFTSKQTADVYGIKVDARYTYSPAFQFFAYADVMAFAFSVLSIFLAYMLERGFLNPPFYFYLFLHDLILGAVLGSACAAAAAVGWVGMYGNSHTGWTAICDQFGRFCNRITSAIAVSYVGFVLILILTVISAKKIGSVHG